MKQLYFVVFLILQFVISGSAFAQTPTISGVYTLVDKQKVNRVLYDFTYQVSIINNDAAMRNVSATVSSTSANTVIIDNSVNFNNLSAGEVSTSIDSFTLRQNRRHSFNPSALNWEVHFEPQEPVLNPMPDIVSFATVARGMKSLIPLRNSLEEESYKFEIVTLPAQGAVELNVDTGLLSYVTNDGSSNDEDYFDYRVTKVDGGETFIARFSIEIIPKQVLLNNLELDGFSSNLPLVIIDTVADITTDPKIKGLLTVIPVSLETGRSSLFEDPEYAGFMEIDFRGHSSLQFPKKNYGVDTEKLSGKDNDVSLLGMPEEHKWILHAPYSDKSLMRNYVAYNKTRDMGGYSAVRTKYVEVLVRQDDGTYRYDGVHVFMEKIKRDKNRVDIKKLKSSQTTLPDITGGYILRQDRDKGDWYFITNEKNSKFVIEYPKTKNLNAEQKNYIEAYMNRFETALYSVGFNDINHENYYGNFINVDSFAKHLLSREFFKDVDTLSLSEFFNLEKEGKLSMLPVWDFNLGMGNANYGYNGRTSNWTFTNRHSGIAGIMNRLMSAPAFKSRVSDIWHDLRGSEWSDDNLGLFIDSTKDLLIESQERNFQRWPSVLGLYNWPNRANVCTGSEFCDTWEKAVDEHLRVWLLERAKWMDEDLSR